MAPVVISDILWLLYGWRLGVVLGLATLGTALLTSSPWGAVIPGGLLITFWFAASCVPLARARHRAETMGLQATFVLGPPGRVSRALGRKWFRDVDLYPDPISPGLLARWTEIHGDTRRRWGNFPRDAVARYRTALERDLDFLCGWGAANGRMLTFSGFVRWPSGLLERLEREGRLVLVQGPLRPYQPRLWTRPRYEEIQERMFGGVWTRKDRTDPAKWWTVVVLPAPAERLGKCRGGG